MKKALLITVTLLLSCPALLADFVTPDEAREVAARFFGYSGNDAVKSSIPVRVDLSWTETVHPEGVVELPAYYVYNREGGGYVIISAESGFHPVIAYSYTETFDAGTLPDGYRYLLGHLADDVTRARLSGRSVSSDVAVEWQTVGIRTKAAKEKVLETADWNQRYPYYLQCPSMNGQYCVTGCVATATAILMRYQGVKPGAPNTPESVTLPGYDLSGGVKCNSRNLSGREYDFAKMPLKDYEVQNASNEVKNSIAELMADLGCAIQMDYSPSGSSATTPKMISVLGDWFRYDKNNTFEPRGAFSFSEWMAKIEDSIDNDNPVLFSGYSSERGGHAFILDGYDGSGFVRYNFGWGGLYHDSFVRIGYDFDINQMACFNLVPAKGDSKYPVTPVYFYSFDREGLSISSGRVAKGENFTLTCDAVTQYGPQEKSFVIRAVLVSGDSRRKISSNYYASILPPSYYTYPFDLYCRIDDDLKMGDYIELEYSAENTTYVGSVETWLPLNKPDDGTVVASYPAVPAFHMDIPSSVKVGESVELKLMNGKIPWATRTEWSWSAVTPGGQAEIQAHSSNWNFINFKTAGTYNVIATIKDGSGMVSDSVVARVTVKN